MEKKLAKINQVLNEGGIILYPTEGVYGLGCDPFNETAVLRLLKIKNRDINKGLILIAAAWSQVKDLISIELSDYPKLMHKNKSPVTWIIPASSQTPAWIKGQFSSVAIRITAHPVAKQICQNFGQAMVSTSANLATEPPITNLVQLNQQILFAIDEVVPGKVGKLGKPTTMCDVRSGKILRY